MTSVSESLGNTPLNAALVAGYEQLSANETITFTQYLRVVLPFDGFVFWVASGILSASAILNTASLNTVMPNQPPSGTAPNTLAVQGSLHYSTQRQQNEDELIDINRVVFTTSTDVDEFNVINQNVMWLASFGDIRFSFSGRGKLYQQAGLYHYFGDAVYPEMETQIVDNISAFDSMNVVVSNSLPIWLAMNSMAPPFPYPPSQYVPLYPSFALPANLQPPYGVVHIRPEDTKAIQSTPILDSLMNRWQLVMDRVKITFYGLRNFNVMDFLDYVNNLSIQDNAPFGLMNMPVARDEKRTQVEMGVLAMKKTIEFEINYYQQRARDVAQQLILTVIPSFILGA
jgi:hypothetical protein